MKKYILFLLSVLILTGCGIEKAPNETTAETSAENTLETGEIAETSPQTAEEIIKIPVKYSNDYFIGNVDFQETIEETQPENATVSDPKTALAFFRDFTSSQTIDKIGSVILSDLTLTDAYCDSSAGYVSLIFTDEKGRIMSFAAAESEQNSKIGSVPLPDDNILGFPKNGENKSYFLKDGEKIEFKIGGMRYGENLYRSAVWQKDGIYYRISALGRGTQDIINAAALVMTDRLAGTECVSECAVPTDLSLYTLDDKGFRVWYNSFNGEWSDGEKTINLTWDDNVFSYADNRLYGFCESEFGAYMAGESGYWFIPEGMDELYFFEDVKEGEPLFVRSYTALYKRSDGKAAYSFSGKCGYLGLCEIIRNTGLTPDDIFNYSFTDENGVLWSFTSEIQADWGDIYIIDEYSEYVLFALLMRNQNGGEQYFTTAIDINPENKYCVIRDEHHPCDVSVLTFDGLSTELSESAVLNADTYNKEYGDKYKISAYPKIEFFYRSDGGYYAVRGCCVMGEQWCGRYEIFYNDGNGYRLLPYRFNDVMGSLYTFLIDDKLLVGHFSENGDDIALTLLDGAEIASEICLKEENYDGFSANCSDGVIELEIYNYGSDCSKGYWINRFFKIVNGSIQEMTDTL